MTLTPKGTVDVSTADADIEPSKSSRIQSQDRQKVTAVQVGLLEAVLMAIQFLPKKMYWKCANYIGVVGRYKS